MNRAENGERGTASSRPTVPPRRPKASLVHRYAIGSRAGDQVLWHITSSVHPTIHSRTTRHPLYSWHHQLRGALLEQAAKLHQEMEDDLLERGEADHAHYVITTQIRHLRS